MKKISVGVFLLCIAPLFITLSFFLLSRSQRICESPSIIGYDDTYVEYAIDNINGYLGGVPKENLSTYDLVTYDPAKSTLQISQVGNWEVVSYMAQNAVNPIFDDDPVHLINIRYRITYEDGSTANLLWNTWNYGRVACPFVVTMGYGPPGQIKIELDG